MAPTAKKKLSGASEQRGKKSLSSEGLSDCGEEMGGTETVRERRGGHWRSTQLLEEVTPEVEPRLQKQHLRLLR